MAKSVSGRQLIRLRSESVASEPSAVQAGHPASAAPLGETPQDRAAATPVGRPASAAPARASRRRGLTKKQAAAWIRILLRLESEMPLSHLADELGFSDRQFGEALGLLVREGKARVRDGPGGLRVVWVETTRQGVPPMPQERR